MRSIDPDYDWTLYFARPVLIMVRQYPGMEYDYHRYCRLLSRIHSALQRERYGDDKRIKDLEAKIRYLVEQLRDS